MNGYDLTRVVDTVEFELFLWAVFGTVLVIFGIFSAILLWHWRVYSTGAYTTTKNMIVYLSVSAICIVTMIGSLLWLSFV